MDNNKILIVGGAGGIGSAIVRKYSDLGYETIIADIDRINGQLLAGACANSEYYYLDVLDTNSIHEFFDELDSKNEKITHFISLAGGALVEEFMGLSGLSDEIIDKSLNLNLKSHIIMVREAMKLFEKTDSTDKSITLISSVNAIKDFGLPVYSSAKAGLIGFMISSLNELAQKGIRINVVSPGTVVTPKTLKEPKDFDALLLNTPMKKFAQTSDIANAVYSITHLITGLNGHNLIVDYGQTV